MTETQKLSKWRVFLLVFATLGLFAALVVVGIALKLRNDWIVNAQLLDVSVIGSEKSNVTTKVLDRNGKEIGEIFEERRTIVPLNEIPDVVKYAFLSAEDKHFYQHDGIDYLATIKASFGNIATAKKPRGASTITQQVVKIYNPGSRTVKLKAQEMYLARQLEKIRTKDEILAFYLNQISLGRQRFGVEAASQYFFGKSVRQVTLHEAALLACLPKAPETYYHKASHWKWKAREGYVLKEMVDNGWLKSEDAKAAFEEKIVLVGHKETNPAPEFLDFAEKQLRAQYGKNLGKLGLEVKTTCDLDLQKVARAELEKGLDFIDRKNGSSPRPQGAVILMDAHTREVLAMVGGYGQDRADFNRALYAKRQPGSTFKAFVWAAAFDQAWTEESKMAPSTTFLDTEKTYEIPGSKSWTPKNHAPATEEEVTMRSALAQSLNTISAQITEKIGPDAVTAMAMKLGVKSELQRPLGRKGALITPISIALGTSEVTPIEMANAYAVFADQGKVTDPSFLIQEKNGSPESKQAISPALAYLMTSVLTDVVENGTAIRAKGQLKRPVAGKTGTTQSATDAWFIGYSADYVAAVWVGYDDSKPLGSYWEGSHASLPIWIGLMKAVHQGRPSKQFARPASGIVEQDGEVYLEGKVPPPREERIVENTDPPSEDDDEDEKLPSNSVSDSSRERAEVADGVTSQKETPTVPVVAPSAAMLDPWSS